MTYMKLNEGIRDLVTMDPEDPWGDTMAALFGICDVLYAANEHIPTAWKFRAALGCNDEIEDLAENEDGNFPYATETIAQMYVQDEITADDLRYAGDVLSRYREVLKLAGLDY